MTQLPAAGRDDIAVALASCARGDRSALKVIYDSETPVLLAVATRIVRRREVAEEVLQDAFVRIWRSASTYDPALGSGRAWVFAIVRNRALNQLRDDRHTPVDDAELESFAARDAEAAAAYDRLGETSALRRCLERLDPTRRNAILLAYVTGLTHGEIAGRLNAPLGTVKAWIRRSLLSLRECMS
ncbi:sigma-70 family RNA polymerase sigma factor [Hansschlegelia quercus]|uniref:Sigma-70 family RNA polymerase sigma factor n=1 Tax=Hansschlegelia quercus TaxID=2528245 RepID=A0A4V2JDB1_9HYPH|nr:sigma-70 family RNA polymerase sigma factor [Hansschlegelia quercus]TBN47912.1 sigma-70 family RNA polymerase sigma factor [Hansschlegelia quercus]